jgi:putative transcriptional regulator
MDKVLIGQKLISLRGERSREGVANDMGISVSALQMYENGQRMPKDEIKVRIARIYNSSVQQIFFEK